MVEITKDKFYTYVVIQKSGICNMMDVKTALFWTNNIQHLHTDDSVDESRIVKLTEDEYKEILFNYGKYWRMYAEND